jgi:hypothetical protein
MKETDIIWVEAISTFRMVYAVRVPKGKEEWAYDTIVMNDAEEVGQEHLGETIVAGRVISESDYLKEFDKLNGYLKSWDNEKKLSKITDITSDEAQ